MRGPVSLLTMCIPRSYTIDIIDWSERHIKSVERVWISLRANKYSGNAGQLLLLYWDSLFLSRLAQRAWLLFMPEVCLFIFLFLPIWERFKTDALLQVIRVKYSTVC